MLVPLCLRTLQIYTNATVAAGLVDDGRSILGGLNEILAELLEQSLHKKDA